MMHCEYWLIRLALLLQASCIPKKTDYASVSLMKPSVDLGSPVARKSKPLIPILLQRFEDGIFPPGGASTFMILGTLRCSQV